MDTYMCIMWSCSNEPGTQGRMSIDNNNNEGLIMIA